MREFVEMICPTGEAKYFCKQDWTGKSPDGQITCRNEAKKRSHGIDDVCAAIELVDDRSADYTNLDVLSLVANNFWNGGIVLSEFATKWPDLEGVLGRATKDRVAIG
jgi:hypothetical protein